MTYFKSLFFNFLAIFFVNHVIPDIEIAYYSKLPHIKGDLIFSFCLGFICSLVFPILKFFNLKPSHFKIGFISFLVSFGGYSLVNILPFGIKVKSPGAFILAGVIVWSACYLTNHLEFKKYQKEQDNKK